MNIKWLSILIAASIATTTLAEDDQAYIEQLADEHLNWVEDAGDLQRIIAYAKAGLASISHDSPTCADDWRGLPDHLGNSERGYPICVEHLELPAEAMGDIARMNWQRFVNESDYDGRITKLYAVRHAGALARHLTQERIEHLAGLFQVPSDLIGEARFSFESPSNDYLGMLRGVVLDDDYQDETTPYQFGHGLIGGHGALTVTFGPGEIVLYPGGGFNTTFYFVITEEYFFFVKREWWNA